jgi:peroxiredoxin
MMTGCGDSTASGKVSIGERAPGFSLKSVSGETVTLDSLQGQAVVLNFWATWCGPCQKEIPELKALAEKSEAKVIGIALDEDPRAVKPFVQRHGVNYTVLLGDQEVFERAGGYGIPYTLILDGSGRVINIYRGPATREAIESDLEGLNQGA